VLLPATMLPLAGGHCAGEIGPVGSAGESSLHGQTACAVMFRPG
jgi:small ligand-binding sensory domain FIST